MTITAKWPLLLVLLLSAYPRSGRAQADQSPGDAPGIVFLQSAEPVNSLEELLQLLPADRKVYVDVWATWCGPCLQEFAHNAPLRELLAAYETDLLYISVDDPGSRRRWKQMIDHYDLQGYHIMVNPALERELRELFGEGGGVALPWYMLFDEAGALAVKYARRPSERKALQRQLRRL